MCKIYSIKLYFYPFLSIKDFVPNEEEKDYVFTALVYYLSNRLIERHPKLYESLASSIPPFRPHQFQDVMNGKSEEFTGPLFTKSESRTEDLVEMMSEIQLNVPTYTDSLGLEHCFEKKIVSGDNKTEKKHASWYH